MKRLEKKIGVALLAGLLVLPLPVFADTDKKEDSSAKTQQTQSKEKTETDAQKLGKHVITFDYAFKKAIDSSRDLEKQRMEVRLLDKKDEQRDSQLLGASANGSLTAPGVGGQISDGIATSLVTNQAQKNTQKRSADYTEQSLKVNMVNIFNRIDTQQKSLKLMEQQIALKTKLNDIAKKQLALGLMSTYDAKVSQSDLEALLQRQKEGQIALKNAYIDLNKYVQVSDITKYTIEPLTYTLKSLESSADTVKAHSYNAADFDIRVYAKEASVNMQQILLDNGISTLPNGVAQATLNVDKSDVEVLKAEVRSNVTNLFSRLNLMSQNIVTQQLTLAAEEKKLANLEVKLKVGTVRPIDIETQQMVVIQSKNAIEEAVKQYETLKAIYLNPSLAGTMGGGGGEAPAAPSGAGASTPSSGASTGAPSGGTGTPTN